MNSVVTRWSVGDKVAVDSTTCPEDAFEGMIGTVTEVYEPGGHFDVSVQFPGDTEQYSYGADELCPATGFMPGASEGMILEKLLGKKIVYFSDLLDADTVDYVRPSNKDNRYYRVERFKNFPELDQIHFVGEFGFRSIYLSAIIRIKK